MDQLIVEALDGPERPPAKLRTSLQMMGLDMSKGTLLVYDGSRADLYRVRVTGSSGGLWWGWHPQCLETSTYVDTNNSFCFEAVSLLPSNVNNPNPSEWWTLPPPRCLRIWTLSRRDPLRLPRGAWPCTMTRSLELQRIASRSATQQVTPWMSVVMDDVLNA